MRKFLKALIMIILILVLMVVGQIAPLAVTDHLNFSENAAVITMTIIYPIIVIGGGWLLNHFLLHQSLPLVSKWRFQCWPILYAILADVLIYLFSWVAQTGFHSSFTTMSNWWLQFAMTVISAPLVEEYVFRGYIFGALDSIFKRSTTIWLTAFLFWLNSPIVTWQSGLVQCSIPCNCLYRNGDVLYANCCSGKKLVG